MPYTQSQIRCLEGMGIVPWVERASMQSIDAVQALTDAVVLAEQAPVSITPPRVPTGANNQPVPPAVLSSEQPVVSASAVPLTAPVEFMQTPLVEIPFRGQRCTQLGKSDAPLLILVEAVSTKQSQYPFEPTDAKIFEDMLRAIAWRRQDVCLAVLPPSNEPWLAASDDGPCVSDLCRKPRDAVLLFRQSVPESLNVDDLTVPLERASMLAWQLPHPALLRASPALKRQAWNVLKAARARLV